jgi:3-oxoacyl-[acyl-carrier-protein] synthase II
MNRRRVKITGLGFVTPAGIGKVEFLSKIQESVSRVEVIARFPEDSGPFVGAEVKGFSPGRHLSGVLTKRMPRHTQFALAGATMAISDAGMTLSDVNKADPLIIVGAALMDFGTINKGIDLILRHGPSSALPTSVSDALVSSIGASIGELVGGNTRTMTFQSACCSGLDAIGRAAELISQGEADLAICGGTEAPLHFHPMLEMKLAGLAPGNPHQPERQSRPFDRWRTTGVIGEGACIMILEAEGSPRQGYAYVEGHGFASDVRGETCSGLYDAMRLAIGNSNMRPNAIEAVSAWGPGHRLIDAAEARVLDKMFAGLLSNIPVYSIKGAIGNPLGAAGAIQTGCAALGLAHGIIPPTVNWVHPDPSCRLNLRASTRYVAHETILINAHGLSGTNSCLVLAK